MASQTFKKSESLTAFMALSAMDGANLVLKPYFYESFCRPFTLVRQHIEIKDIPDASFEFAIVGRV